MGYSKKYEFVAWNEWDHCISDAIVDFYQVYKRNPNILLANKHTYSQIDFITNVNEVKKNNAHLVVDKHIDDYLDSLTSEKDAVSLTSFKKGDCKLIFAIATEPELGNKDFVLLYDDDTDGDDDDNLPVTRLDKIDKRVLV